jgi:hypothetical protein
MSPSVASIFQDRSSYEEAVVPRAGLFSRGKTNSLGGREGTLSRVGELMVDPARASIPPRACRVAAAAKGQSSWPFHIGAELRLLGGIPRPPANSSNNAIALSIGSSCALPSYGASRPVFRELISSVFISFVEAISGSRLDPHPHRSGRAPSDRGGGCESACRLHRYERLKLDRRVNLLLYLNRDWKEEYGGHLQLWDQEMKTCIKKVLPIFNRLVLFSSTDVSFHGHPTP